MDFKLNSIPQNRLVRWGLHPLIYCELDLSLVDVGLSTHPLTLMLIHLGLDINGWSNNDSVAVKQ